MKKMISRVVLCLMLAMVLFVYTTPLATYAEADGTAQETVETEGNGTSAKAIAAAVAIGLASLGGAIGMGIGIAKSVEGISRQPEAEGKIRTNLMLGLVFIETVVIYALIVAILVIFVL